MNKSKQLNQWLWKWHIIGGLVSVAAKNGMNAVAMTDHANMMGAFHFVKEVGGYNKSIRAQIEEAEANGETPTVKEIVPIVGCEFFVCEDHTDKSRTTSTNLSMDGISSIRVSMLSCIVLAA